MIGLIRNILAFASTFAIITMLTMVLLQFVFAMCGYHDRPGNRQALYALLCGIMLALLLIPFYYFPC
ncbi:MAG: hypothetical protein ACI3YT_07255 [Prevotella sp.]